MDEIFLTEQEKRDKRIEEAERKLKRVEEILKMHGIEIKIGGCGCCESPWVSFKFREELILDDVYNCNINTFKE